MFARDQIDRLSNIASRQAIISAAILFQITWFACVLGPPVLWIFAVLVYFSLYFMVFRCARFLSYILVAGVIGIVTDFSLFKAGVFQFENGRFPIWLVALWFVFVSSIPIAFSFLRNRYFLAFILGGFGGASSYFAAVRLRADVSFGLSELYAVGLLVGIWALLMPLLIYLLKLLETKLKLELSQPN